MNKLFMWVGILLARIYFLFRSRPIVDKWVLPHRALIPLDNKIDIDFNPVMTETLEEEEKNEFYTRTS